MYDCHGDSTITIKLQEAMKVVNNMSMTTQGAVKNNVSPWNTDTVPHMTAKDFADMHPSPLGLALGFADTVEVQ